MISRDRREYMRNYQRNRYNTDSGFKEMNKARTKKRHFLKRLSECLMKRMSASTDDPIGSGTDPDGIGTAFNNLLSIVVV